MRTATAAFSRAGARTSRPHAELQLCEGRLADGGARAGAPSLRGTSTPARFAAISCAAASWSTNTCTAPQHHHGPHVIGRFAADGHPVVGEVAA